VNCGSQCALDWSPADGGLAREPPGRALGLRVVRDVDISRRESVDSAGLRTAFACEIEEAPARSWGRRGDPLGVAWPLLVPTGMGRNA
jgi:hypothetical protein